MEKEATDSTCSLCLYVIFLHQSNWMFFSAHESKKWNNAVYVVVAIDLVCSSIIDSDGIYDRRKYDRFEHNMISTRGMEIQFHKSTLQEAMAQYVILVLNEENEIISVRVLSQTPGSSLRSGQQLWRAKLCPSGGGSMCRAFHQALEGKVLDLFLVVQV